MKPFKRSALPPPPTPEEQYDRELAVAREEEKRYNVERLGLYDALLVVADVPQRLRAEYDSAIEALDRPAAIEAKRKLDEHPVDLALARAKYQQALMLHNAAQTRVQQIEDRPRVAARAEASRAREIELGLRRPDGSPRFP